MRYATIFVARGQVTLPDFFWGTKIICLFYKFYLYLCYLTNYI